MAAVVASTPLRPGAGHAPASGRSPRGEAAALARRWRARARPWDGDWPDDAAAAVTGAMLGALARGDDEALHGAGRRFGATQHHTGALTAALDALHATLLEDNHDPAAVERVLDGVLAGAALSLSRRLEVEARLDELTGVGNRRAFDEDLADQLAASQRHSFPLTVVVADLDDMKHINDRDGHHAGDAALVRFVAAARAALRQGDRVYRIGGDEFAVVMPYCDAAHGTRSMTRVAVGEAPRFSWGVACSPLDGTTAPALLDAADGAMYRHKARGRPGRRAAAAR